MVTLGALVDRVVRGPYPPVGVVRSPAPSRRCRVGLHLWVKVWAFTRISPAETSGVDEDGREYVEHTARLALNPNRRHDYIECARCGEFRG